MNTDHYKQRLLELEQEIATRIERALGNARASEDGPAGDIGDQSVSDEVRGEQLTEANADSDVLNQVRAALQRIDSGTFGECLADGEPIEAKRLDAVPWAAYCLKHQELLDAPESAQRATL